MRQMNYRTHVSYKTNKFSNKDDTRAIDKIIQLLIFK